MAGREVRKVTGDESNKAVRAGREWQLIAVGRRGEKGRE